MLKFRVCRNISFKTRLQRQTRKQLRSFQKFYVITCYVSLIIACFTLVGAYFRDSTCAEETFGYINPGQKPLQIVVLTFHRDVSLQRLLRALAATNYSSHRVDLRINIDGMATDMSEQSKKDHARVKSVSNSFKWQHGDKKVHERQTNIGLAESWFRATDAKDYTYTAIFEDDLEVNVDFFDFLLAVDHMGVLQGSHTTALCLHPGNWEVPVARTCPPQYSNLFYESPEPCNWGPIWKTGEWFQYLDFVRSLQQAKERPFVPEKISYNYNAYLTKDLDVQSPWLWRYNWENSKRQIRYSTVPCSKRRKSNASPQEHIYMAINHKEAGAHFKGKQNLDNDPSLLLPGIKDLSSKLTNPCVQLRPEPFLGYKSYDKSLLRPP